MNSIPTMQHYKLNYSKVSKFYLVLFNLKFGAA